MNQISDTTASGTASGNAAALAAALTGTRTLPEGLAALRIAAQEAWAYHRLNPYPLYHFREWKVEDRGPMPRCLPIARRALLRGARFLFGKALTLKCAGNDAWEAFVQDAWQENAMSARLVPLAVRGALESGVVLKYAYDEARKQMGKTPLSIQTLSVVDDVRLYWDPHDRERLLMARVQYPYFDAAQNETFWYREEWTDAEEVHYQPVAAGDLQSAKATADAYEGWKVSSRAANPFGVIPLVYIKNLESDDTWGWLDLQDLYRVLDNVHLTFHLMNKSNQFDAEINPVYIDAEMDEQDVDRPLQPSEGIAIQSREEGGHQAKVQEIGGANALRPAMMEYARELIRQVEDAASTVNVNQAEFTNKGNLTTAVLQQLYQPQIEITEEKHKSWGQDGICAFWACAARGLANLGVAGLGLDLADADSYKVEIGWPAYFDLSQDELTAITGRTQEQEIAGYLTHERSVQRVAQAEGIEDVGALQEELKKEPRPSPTAAADPAAQAPSLQNMETEVKGLDRVGGDDSK